MNDSLKIPSLKNLPLKILQVSNFGYKRNFHQFYNCDYKIYFGLIKNGHSVYQFSNRDIARQEGFFKSRFGATAAQNNKLIKVAKTIKPDLILIGHAEQISNYTLLEIKKLLPQVKIAAFNVDALWVEHNLKALQERAKAVDAMFITTAGAENLKQFANAGTKISFIPNPTNSAIDKYKNFDNTDHIFDVFFAGGGEYRTATCKYLKDNFPNLKFSLFGQSGTPLLYGENYFEELSKCWIGLNLPQFTEDKYQPYLYSSDRISQYFGNGLLTFVHRKTGYERYFKDGVEAYFYDSWEELKEKITHATKNKAESLKIAEAGWRKYHENYNSQIVTKYIVERSFNQPLSQEYHWPTELF